jgi:hypothetical protein
VSEPNAAFYHRCLIVMRRVRLLAVLGLLVVLAAACNGKSSSSSSAKPGKDDIVAEVASFDLTVGPPSRILVGVLTGDQRFVVYGTVQFRFAYLGTKQDNSPGAYGQAVDATFLAIPGSTVPTPAPSAPVATTGTDVKGVYAANAGFPKSGFYQVQVTAKLAGKSRTATSAFAVNEQHQVPGVGDVAPPVDNLTVASTDAPQAAIDSRASTGAIPDPELHQTTVAAAVAAHRPAVVVFATPVYCQSRFCGPVTDMVQDLSHTYANRASFIHVEIWRDYQNQTLNKAAADWLLRNGNLNEPWVFVIGSDGKIAARFDNVATADELRPILEKLPVIGPAT